jgi:hypothetical protein
MPPSSRGLGHFPFTEVTGIRIPLGVLKIEAKHRSLASFKIESLLFSASLIYLSIYRAVELSKTSKDNLVSLLNSRYFNP